MNLKELRIEKKMTQQEVADLVGISLRSYKSYENDADKKGTLKYDYIFGKLKDTNVIDEEHGILEIEDIKQACEKIFKRYNVYYCYLFGSYAKGKATETSDVDLLISTDTTGLDYYGLVEELRSSLHKKVDLLNIQQLKDNLELTNEILEDGVRVYGKSKE